jgi:hypothetical protein
MLGKARGQHHVAGNCNQIRFSATSHPVSQLSSGTMQLVVNVIALSFLSPGPGNYRLDFIILVG